MSVAPNARHQADRSTSAHMSPGDEMVWVPGGVFQAGSNDFYPEERPVRQLTVDGFWIDRHPVTNAQFSQFVRETGYVTVAERAPAAEEYPGAIPEMLVPGSLVFQRTSGPVRLDDWSQWWRWVPGACWRHPEGPGSSITKRKRHPVVHVAYKDARAYSEWRGRQLPTEVEWEYAARGGLDGAVFVWGDDERPQGRVMSNHWQGEFPWRNDLLDRHAGTSPVGSFPPNGYGLFDMAGNVWEWTDDWYIANRQSLEAPSPCCAPVLPRSARLEESLDPTQPEVHIPRKVIKGGSHLCAPNYCLRYRPAARQPQMVDTGMCHLGFRCVSRSSPAGDEFPGKQCETR
ncbi:MAG TPA: formylglycine-generating enzyme family protein [Thermomicrobiales bacterium]|nr:formylglycine-generating enzyme family protein [Thermomicrobiales bacterium]